MLGTAWAGLACTARPGRKSFAGMGGIARPMGHAALHQCCSPPGPSEVFAPAFEQIRLCGCSPSSPQCFPLQHGLQFLFPTSGWQCPTRCLPPIKLCFGKQQKRERNSSAVVFPNTKTREKYVVLSMFQKSVQLFHQEGLHSGPQGSHTIMRHPSLSSGDMSRLCFLEEIPAHVCLDHSRHLSASLLRWLLHRCELSPSQLPLLL